MMTNKKRLKALISTGVLAVILITTAFGLTACYKNKSNTDKNVNTETETSSESEYENPTQEESSIPEGGTQTDSETQTESTEVNQEDTSAPSTESGSNNTEATTESGTTNTESTQKQPEEIDCKEVTLNKTSLILKVGDKKTLTATVSPKNTTDVISWSTSDRYVVDLSPKTEDNKVQIKAVGTGTAVVKVTVGNRTTKCKVTVEKKKTESSSSENNSNSGSSSSSNDKKPDKNKEEKPSKTITQMKKEAVEVSLEKFDMNGTDIDAWNWDHKDGTVDEHEAFVVTTRWLYNKKGEKCLFHGYYSYTEPNSIWVPELEGTDRTLSFPVGLRLDDGRACYFCCFEEPYAIDRE